MSWIRHLFGKSKPVRERPVDDRHRTVALYVWNKTMGGESQWMLSGITNSFGWNLSWMCPELGVRFRMWQGNPEYGFQVRSLHDDRILISMDDKEFSRVLDTEDDAIDNHLDVVYKRALDDIARKGAKGVNESLDELTARIEGIDKEDA